MRRSLERSRLDYVDGRESRFSGLPGEHHLYTTTPRIRELREQAGITDAEAGELLRDQHHGLGTLKALENGNSVPGIVAARVCAALNINYAAAKGEL